jgi:hypothetical protein
MFAMVRQFSSLQGPHDHPPPPWAPGGEWKDWTDAEKTTFCTDKAPDMDGKPGFNEHCDIFTA